MGSVIEVGRREDGSHDTAVAAFDTVLVTHHVASLLSGRSGSCRRGR